MHCAQCAGADAGAGQCTSQVPDFRDHCCVEASTKYFDLTLQDAEEEAEFRLRGDRGSTPSGACHCR